MVTASMMSSCIRMISALSIAMSLPAPTATPTSALMSAGASLIPSPIISTFLPIFCKSLICSSFWSGKTSAITSSSCNFLCIAFAVIALSPVSIMVLIPSFLNSTIACSLVSFTVSATARIPNISPFCSVSCGS